MRNIRKLVLLTSICLWSATLFSQSGWNVGNRYQYRGAADVNCGPTYVIQNTDGWNYWNEGWKNCRKRVWYQEWYSGYIYLWGPNGWYTEWREGNYWYFNWYDYKVRAW